MLARALVDGGYAQEALSVALVATCSNPAEFALLQVGAEAADKLGDAQRSAAIYHLLAEARPQDWHLWNNLGNALAAQVKWSLAVDAFSRAAALRPEEVIIQRNLVAALQACGRQEESVPVLERLLAGHPADLDARLALAGIYAATGQNEAASTHLAVAFAQQPARVDIAMQFARCLVELTRFADAEDVYRQILALDPGNADAVYELGLTLERTSRLTELGELLQASRAAGVAEEELAFLNAALAFRNGKAEEARAFLELQPPGTDPVRWHRLQSKIADALHDPHRAFTAAEAMNRSVMEYEEWRGRGAQYRARLKDMAQFITPDWCARIPQLPQGDRRSPAFLVGFPRSGTTLLDTFLMGHGNVHVLEEVRMLGAAELVIRQLAGLPECSAETLAQARAAYFDVLDQHVPAGFDGLVVDKLPLNILGAPLIYALFPDARVIFSLRHPCDAVLSGFMQSFVLNDAMACFLDLEDAADLYDSAMDVWQRARSNLPLTVHGLRYEALISEPVASLKPLIDFLGLEWTDRVLDHQATAAARGPVATASYDQVTQPLTSRPSGRWRDYRNQMLPVLPTLLKWADEFGYLNAN